MPSWYDITRGDAYQALPETAKSEAKRRFFDREVLPSLADNPALQSNEARGLAFQKFMSTPDDTGQGYTTSLVGSAGRGLAEMVPGAIEGVGALTASDYLTEAGRGLREKIGDFSPVNPIYEQDFIPKAFGAGGQALGMIGTGGVGGITGKVLGGIGAVSKGAKAAVLGSAALQGAAEGQQQAEQYGLTGTDKYLRTLAGSGLAIGTEALPFGTAAETALATRLLSKTPRAAAFGKDTLTEGAEEVAEQIGGNVATKTLAPEGTETPGVLEGTLEAGALGTVGGGVIGGINAITRIPIEQQTPEQKSRAAEFEATPVETVNFTPEESQANQEAGGPLVVGPEGEMAYAPPPQAPVEETPPEPVLPPPDATPPVQEVAQPGIAEEVVQAPVQEPAQEVAAPVQQVVAAELPPEAQEFVAEADEELAANVELVPEVAQAAVESDAILDEALAAISEPDLEVGIERNRAVIEQAANMLLGKQPANLAPSVQSILQPAQVEQPVTNPLSPAATLETGTPSTPSGLAVGEGSSPAASGMAMEQGSISPPISATIPEIPDASIEDIQAAMPIIQALESSIAQLPPVAQQKWTPEMRGKAAKFYVTRNATDLEGLNPIQRKRVYDALYSVDKEAAADQDQQEAILRERVKEQEKQNRKIAEDRESQLKGEVQRREALDTLMRAVSYSTPSSVSVGVTLDEALGAQEMIHNAGDVPGILNAFIGTSQDFLANQQNAVDWPELYEMLKSGIVNEGSFYNGRAFVFTDGIGINSGDRAASRELGISPGMAAARRVLIHESLVHRGVFGLPVRMQRRLLNWVKQNATPEELDATALSYPDYADWRTNLVSESYLVEEHLARIVEKLTKIPDSGPLGKLMDILRDIWRWITGQSGEPTLQNLKDVVKLLKAGVASNPASETLLNGDPVLLKDSRLSYSSPLSAQLAAASSQIRSMTESLPPSDLVPEVPQTVPPAQARQVVQNAYNRALAGQGSVQVSLESVYQQALQEVPTMTRHEFGAAVQALYEDGRALLAPSEQSASTMNDGEEWRVFDEAGVPAGMVAIMPEEQVRNSVRNGDVSAAIQANKGMRGVLRATVPSANLTQSQARPFVDQTPADFHSHQVDPQVQSAIQIVDNMESAGIPSMELFSVMMSPEFQEAMGIAQDPAFQEVLVLEAKKRLSQQSIKAADEGRDGDAAMFSDASQKIGTMWFSKQGTINGRALGMRGSLMKHPHFADMFLQDGIMDTLYKQSDEVLRANVVSPEQVTADINKAGQTANEGAADEVDAEAQDLADAEYERLGEQEMSAESMEFIRQIRAKNERRGRLIASINAEEGSIKASSAAAPNDIKSMTLAQKKAELAMLDKEVEALVGKLRKSLEPKKSKTAAPTKPTTNARRLVAKTILQTDTPLTIQEVMDSLLPQGPSMRDEMIENLVDGVVGKARSVVEQPKKAKELNALRNQLRRILQANVKGEQPEATQESLGQRALKAFGYVTSNDQTVREAWDKAREEVLKMLREVEAAEMGIPADVEALSKARAEVARVNDLIAAGNDTQKVEAATKLDTAEQEVSRIKQQIADKNKTLDSTAEQRVAKRDSLMDSTPRQLYVASQARGVLRDALKESGFDTSKKLLAEPQKAREAVVQTINNAVAQEPDVDPARWQRDQSYLLNAFDKMVADLQQQQENARKASGQKFRKELFTGDQKKALQTILRKLNAARPGDAAPLSARITWRKLLGSPQGTQAERRQRMEDIIASDPALESLSQAEQKQLAELIDAAWESRRNDLFASEIKRLTGKTKMEAKAKSAIEEKTSKLLEMVNNGTFDNAQLSKIVAEKYGIRQLTGHERTRLRQIAEELQKDDLTPWKRAKLAQELRSMLIDVTNVPFAQIADAWWVSSVLSGPRTWFTIGLAFLAGGYEIIGDGMITILKNPGDPNAWAAAMKSIQAWVSSMGREGLVALAYIRTGDESLLDPSFYDGSQYLEQGLTGLASGSVGEKLLKSKNKTTRMAGGFMEFMSRLLRALDAFNTNTTKHGMLPLSYYLNTKVFSPSEMSSVSDIKAAKKHVRNTVFGGRENLSFMESRNLDAWARNYLHQQIEKMEGVLEYATAAAEQAAMSLDPTGVGGAFYHSIVGLSSRLKQSSSKYLQEAKEGMLNAGEDKGYARTRLALAYFYQFAAHNMMSAIGLKFARFGGNKFNQTLSFIPFVGYLRSYEKGVTSSGYHAQMIQRNQMVGGFAMAAAYSILKAIGDEPDDEKRGWGIEGSWANLTPERKSQLLASGNKEYTIYYKGQRLNYANWPISGVLSAIGSLADMIKYSPDQWSEKSVANKIASAAYAAAVSAADSAAMSQLAEVLGTSVHTRDPLDASMSRMSKIAANYAGGYIPRFLKDVDLMANPNLNSYKTLWAKTAQQMPIYRRFEGQELLNVLGDRVAPSRTPWSREFIDQPAQPIYGTLGKLNSRGLWLTSANPDNRLVGRGNNKRPLTQPEADRYVKLTGEGYKRLIEIHGSRLLNMPRDRANTYLQEQASKIRDRALKRSVTNQKQVD